MNIKAFLILLIMAVLALQVYTQDEMSPAARALDEEVKTGNSQAILDAGDSGDKSLIPYLKALYARSKAPSAKIALAKLGDEAALRDILSEANSTDENIRQTGMDKLVTVGGKPAFQYLYEKLNQLKPTVSDEPEGRRRTTVEVYEGAYELFYYLNRLVPDPPKAERGPKYWTDQIALWKKWFEDHPDSIQ
jgi:hypothetical protein